MHFNPARISLLERGFVIGIAHVRGGGEQGHSWWLNGRGVSKPNGANDFISCIRTLISTKYTSPNKLCIAGGSAGATLMAMVTNRLPFTMKAVVMHSPFLDVLTAMSGKVNL